MSVADAQMGVPRRALATNAAIHVPCIGEVPEPVRTRLTSQPGPTLAFSILTMKIQHLTAATSDELDRMADILMGGFSDGAPSYEPAKARCPSAAMQRQLVQQPPQGDALSRGAYHSSRGGLDGQRRAKGGGANDMRPAGPRLPRSVRLSIDRLTPGYQ